MKEGIFISPQIRDLIKDEYFDKLLQGDEKAPWDSFKLVGKGFLGNRRPQNYEELVNTLLQSYQKLGCNMSLKIYFLHSHLDFFPENRNAVSDEHGKHFHQTFLRWRRDMKGNGTELCSPTTVGLCDRQNEKNYTILLVR